MYFFYEMEKSEFFYYRRTSGVWNQFCSLQHTSEFKIWTNYIVFGVYSELYLALYRIGTNYMYFITV